jgi:hypothetical protein
MFGEHLIKIRSLWGICGTLSGISLLSRDNCNGCHAVLRWSKLIKSMICLMPYWPALRPSKFVIRGSGVRIPQPAQMPLHYRPSTCSGV